MIAISSEGGASVPLLRKATSAVNPLPLFYDDWRQANGIDAAKWFYSITSTATVANIVDGSEDPRAGKPSAASFLTGTTSGSQALVRSQMRVFPIRHGQTALTTSIVRTNVEFVIRGNGTASSIDNTAAFFGVGTSATATRASNSTFGFGWASDVTQAFSDNAGTETTQAFTSAVTFMAQLHKYKISLDYSAGLQFYVDDVLQATITTNIPNAVADGYILYVAKNDAAATWGFEPGEVRVWTEDIL